MVALPQKPWREELNPPRNFPTTLVPVLIERAARWLNGDHFIQRIHILGPAHEPRLRIWWRKDLSYRDAAELVNTLVLDATADEYPPNVVMPTGAVYPAEPADWPTNVIVHQRADNVLDMRTFGIVRKGKPETARHRKSRANWYKRAKDYLDQFLRDWPIGVITT